MITMYGKIVSAATALLMLGLVSPSWGITISEPKSGTIYHPGDKVVVRAVGDTGEMFIGVFIYSLKSHASVIDNLPPYELEYTIDPKFTGEDIIVASGKFPNGKTIETEVKILVTLPSSVMLMGIQASPNHVFVYKLPDGSDPDDIRFAETKSLSVSGLYSDGVKREITSSVNGTTYTSNNEKVVIVTAEGKVIAKGPGTAKITIKNGKYEITVKVDVEQEK